MRIDAESAYGLSRLAVQPSENHRPTGVQPPVSTPETWSSEFPALGTLANSEGFIKLPSTSDGRFHTGTEGVSAIAATGDAKVEFVAFPSHTLAHVKSSMGYPAYYPIHPVTVEYPLKAVLMDLDGTSVHSEEFWMWMIQMTMVSLLENPKFELEDADLPFVSGHSVSEHLLYAIAKYCPGKSVETARQFYYQHVHREMHEIMEGRGRENAFVPAPNLKEFLLELKARKIKIGLVTSGLYEKAMPEIISAFRSLKMGDPLEFYDAIITAGSPMRKGIETGTLGELSPKPHPWLYAEACRVGLGISPDDRAHVIGIEDSGAGVCSIRLANFSCCGIGGGNIIESGTRGLCWEFRDTLADILQLIR